MTDSSKLRRIKMCIEASKRHHANAIDTSNDALDGDIKPKDALASIRTALEASSGHLSSAHQHLLQLLRDRPDDGADDANEELSAVTPETRRKVLDRFDRTHVGVARAQSPAPVTLGPASIGGAHTTNHCRAKEAARLKALWLT